ncbi:Sacchrp_dh_NADP domain-containing protein [Haematococcus lacustris]|uniref:Sacchrp_dh_NADP domain-containing protein n=1 Tax=Haematococcus lacustris TaxID=44745 RepID=A0A699ZGE2_HAELA|nr:Sacchrp_dh_NADP domain-containing protein [Haematococcus lacustris]
MRGHKQSGGSRNQERKLGRVMSRTIHKLAELACIHEEWQELQRHLCPPAAGAVHGLQRGWLCSGRVARPDQAWGVVPRDGEKAARCMQEKEALADRRAFIKFAATGCERLDLNRSAWSLESDPQQIGGLIYW